MQKTVTDNNNKKHVIRIDKDLDFLAAYLSKAKSLGVPVWRLKAIKGYTVPHGKTEHQLGATNRYQSSSKLTITIRKYHKWRPRDGKYETQSWHNNDTSHVFEFTLDVFAHELTHLTYWTHTPDRMIFEKKLQLAFARLAKKRGYKGYVG